MNNEMRMEFDGFLLGYDDHTSLHVQSYRPRDREFWDSLYVADADMDLAFDCFETATKSVCHPEHRVRLIDLGTQKVYAIAYWQDDQVQVEQFPDGVPGRDDPIGYKFFEDVNTNRNVVPEMMIRIPVWVNAPIPKWSTIVTYLMTHGWEQIMRHPESKGGETILLRAADHTEIVLGPEWTSDYRWRIGNVLENLERMEKRDRKQIYDDIVALP